MVKDSKTIRLKTNRNKRNNQLTITIPRKKLPSDLKYAPELVVELKILKGK